MCDGQVAEELQSGQNASFVPRIHWQILYGRIGQDMHHALPIQNLKWNENSP